MRELNRDIELNMKENQDLSAGGVCYKGHITFFLSTLSCPKVIYTNSE